MSGITAAATATAATVASTASAAAPYLTVASAGLSMMGAASQANGLTQAGSIAVQQAGIRQEQANLTAEQEYQNADEEVAAGQRKSIQDLTQGDVAAGRAQAVMAASGAGINTAILASIKGKANYNAGVDAWSAGDKARQLDNQGLMTSWGGAVGVTQGEEEQAADDSKANSTLISGIAGAGLSLAGKYGGSTKTNTTNSTAGDSLNPAADVAADVALDGVS